MEERAPYNVNVSPAEVSKQAYTYENFIRTAFKLSLGKDIERAGDPAKLADGDLIRIRSLSKVKAATLYSIYIYNELLENKPNKDETARIGHLIADIIVADNIEQVLSVIEEFKSIAKQYILI